MAYHDLQARFLKILGIKSLENVPMSVDNELRYDPGVSINSDFTLIPKWYADQMGGGYVYFTDNSDPGITVNLAAGTVTLSDILTDFPVISGNGLVRLQASTLVSGNWTDGDYVPDYGSVTKDIDGNILTATFTLGNVLTSIRGRIN